MTEEWLVNFKNETTTIPQRLSLSAAPPPVWAEPSATRCQGVPMCTRLCASPARLTPPGPLGETLKGKLPQRKIVNSAAQGYSSYGNQIGLATGYVKGSIIPAMLQREWKSALLWALLPGRMLSARPLIRGISSFFWAGVRAATESALPVLPRFTPLPPLRCAGLRCRRKCAHRAQDSEDVPQA